MSKSLSQYILPGIGIFAIVIGGGIAFVNRDHAGNKIAELEHKLGNAEYEASKAVKFADAAKQSATEDASKVADLEAKVEQVQAEADKKIADVASLANLREPAPKSDETYGLGRAALSEEIKAWDVDVLPDGRGLPKGSGDAIVGEEVFADKCASCHGDFAEGVNNWPVLAGGLDTLADKDPVKTVGSYWPHLSTVWDYVNRSMPFGEAQTLTSDEVYAITAYILYSNDLVEEDFVLNEENFPQFEMYNKDGFVIDTRAEEEYAIWRTEPCMENCKQEVKITMRASVLDVTPDAGGSGEMDEASHSEETATPVFTAAAKPAEEAAPVSAFDPELVKKGEKVFKKCKACHQVGEGAKNKVGPHLNNSIGRLMGSVEGFKYSKVFQKAKAEGRVWDEAAMTEFLKKPRSYMKGTKMSFSGLKKQADFDAILEFLKTKVE